MKVDLHVHSKYSWDSKVRIEDYISLAEKLGLGAIAITDHNSIESHEAIQSLQEETSVILIPGQEVSTADGHLLVYGYLPKIDQGLSMKDSVALVKRYSKKSKPRTIAAHPFDRFRGGKGKIVLQSGVSGIETLNASAWFPRPNSLAKKHAPENFIKLGNSDAHRLDELGTAYSEIPESDSIESVLSNLREAIALGRRIGIRRKTKRFVKRKFSHSDD